MTEFTYFAYGSNMLQERLQKRCGLIQNSGIAIVHGSALAFCKKSEDGSGKATIVKTVNDNGVLYGVLYELDLGKRLTLDRYEGPGYERVDNFVVRPVDNKRKKLAVTTYIAVGTQDHNLAPYEWYKDLIVAGARQNGFPISYIRWLEAFPTIPDPDSERPSRKEALLVLERVQNIS